MPDFLIVVDVQPGYQKFCEHIVADVVEKINVSDVPVYVFYNGPDLGLDTLENLQAYYLEAGLDEEALDSINFIEKSYGFYRPFMDAGVSQDGMVALVRKMIEQDITDLRDVEDAELWLADVLDENDREIALTSLDYGDAIFAPDFDQRSVDALGAGSRLELIGGGVNECLTEIDIYLTAKGHITEVNHALTYGGEYEPNYSASSGLRM